MFPATALLGIAVERAGGVVATRFLAYAEDVWYVPKSSKDGLRGQLQPILLMAQAYADARGVPRGYPGGGEGDGRLLTGILGSGVSRDGVQTTGS